jgi:small-conductance mechanosensitive channel
VNRRSSIRSKFSRVSLLLICLALLGAAALAAAPALAAPAAQAPTPTPDPALDPTPLPGVPVRLGGRLLYYVYNNLGPLSAAERAALTEKKLATLAGDPFAPPLEIVLAETEQGISLMAGDLVLLTVTSADAAAQGLSRDEFAQSVAETIVDAVHDYRQQITPQARIKAGLVALGILFVVIAILVLLNGLFERLEQNADKAGAVQEQGDLIASTGIYHSGLWRKLVHLLVTIARVVVVLVMLFIVLPFILNLFPFTREIAQHLIAFLRETFSEIWSWLNENRTNFLTILLVILATYGLTRLVRAIFAEIEQGTIHFRNFDRDWAPFTSRIINFLLLVGAAIVIFPYIPGSDSEAFQGIAIFLGALFTLSSTAAVANIVSGVIQTYTGAFRVGDVIRINETVGTVIEKRLLTTRVRTFKQEDVSFPNSLVMNVSVVNYSSLAKDAGVVLYTTVTIGYDVPWRTVHSLLLGAAANVEGFLKAPPPFVLQTSLDDYYISYQLNAYTKSPQIMPLLYSQLHQNIQDAFNQAGVEIMSPAFTALRDGNTVTIPPESRPPDYRAPGFRME